jgi:uncharacterized membrane protein
MLGRLQRRERSNERGATFVITAIAMVALLGAGAMGVDLGFEVDGNQQAQATADVGALDMARYINIADGYKTSNPSITTYLNGKLANVSTDNALDGGGATLSYAVGTWSSTSGWKAATGPCYAQLHTLNVPCTAVKVTATQTVPRIFAGGSATATRSAVGYLNPTTAFSIGTYLANLNTQQGPVLNAIMSQISGSANLTLVGYEGLADTYITLKQLIAAGAAAGVVLSPTTIMNTSLTSSQWLSIFKAAAYNQQLTLNCASSPEPSACVAYSSLQSLSGGGSASATLCQLVTIYGAACGGAVPQGDLGASVDVLQTLETEAELANGTSGIDLGTSLGLSGVTDAKLVLNVVQPPQIAWGSVGATATSAQVQSTLRLFVLGVGEIDVSLGAAEGTATLLPPPNPAPITCFQTNNAVQQVMVNANTTAATGTVTLIDSALGVNQAVASTSASGVSQTPITFTAPIPPPTSEFGQGASANPFQIGATAPNVSITALAGLSSPITSLLGGPTVSLLISQLQSALSGVLQAAGVTVAGADVADLSIDCDSVSLVQ